jgi:hypothetical protein
MPPEEKIDLSKHAPNIEWLEEHGFVKRDAYRQPKGTVTYGANCNYNATNYHFEIYLHPDGKVGGKIDYLTNKKFKEKEAAKAFKNDIGKLVKKCKKSVDKELKGINKQISKDGMQLFTEYEHNAEIFKLGAYISPSVHLHPCNETAEQVFNRISQALEIMERDGLIEEDKDSHEYKKRKEMKGLV